MDPQREVSYLERLQHFRFKVKLGIRMEGNRSLRKKNDEKLAALQIHSSGAI